MGWRVAAHVERSGRDVVCLMMEKLSICCETQSRAPQNIDDCSSRGGALRHQTMRSGSTIQIRTASTIRGPRHDEARYSD